MSHPTPGPNDAVIIFREDGRMDSFAPASANTNVRAALLTSLAPYAWNCIMEHVIDALSGGHGAPDQPQFAPHLTEAEGPMQ